MIGEPSAKLVDDLKAQEAARIADTKTRLGSEGLAKLARKVEEAQAENDKPIPPEMLRSFHLPDMNGIDWLEVQTARSGILSQDRSAHEGPLQDHIDRDAAELPYFVQFDRTSRADSVSAACLTQRAQTFTRTSSRSPSTSSCRLSESRSRHESFFHSTWTSSSARQ